MFRDKYKFKFVLYSILQIPLTLGTGLWENDNFLHMLFSPKFAVDDKDAWLSNWRIVHKNKYKQAKKSKEEEHYLVWRRARWSWYVVLRELQLHGLDDGVIPLRTADVHRLRLLYMNWRLESTWITPWSCSGRLPHQIRKGQGCHWRGVEGQASPLSDKSTWTEVVLDPEGMAA